MQADEFLKTGEMYHLGDLPTETRHPLTMHLSEWAKTDLPRAINALVQVDVKSLNQLAERIPDILRLRAAIQLTLKEHGKIYLVGCGATGRLSLTLEVLWREMFPGDDRVVAFMAGGDMALVHSLEGFEDFPAYGARQMLELGFGRNDLLIACTEGGETPYVIGATEKAAEISKRAPFFLYCNPDQILCDKVERSRNVIKNPKIEKINLTVGPMALSGSTRMQASTVLQLAVGYALLTTFDSGQIADSLKRMQNILQENAAIFLPEFIERESETYLAHDYVMYSVRDFAITVFTDTTERAPTFSLTPFSHKHAEALLKRQPSLCYIHLPEAKNAAEAWRMLLKRQPRPLNWTEIDARTSSAYLEAFDFSPAVKKFRAELVGADREHLPFAISRVRNPNGDEISWKFLDVERGLLLPAEITDLEAHTLLKMFINMHSTLIMGRIGRFKNNVMTWVYPTNGKLIDRATRYVRGLLKDEGIDIEYDKVVRRLFFEMPNVKSGESIVLKVVKSLGGGQANDK
jgi:N-acetylmuramic acid 6-phosphate etherase